MSRSAIPIETLPAHLQAKARAQMATQLVVPAIVGPNAVVTSPPRAKRIDRESPTHIAVVAWANEPDTLAAYPDLAALYHIPNEVGAGGKRSARSRQIEGAKKQAMGRRPGMPDLVLPTPRRAPDGSAWGALYLELKDESTGVVRKAQLDRMRILRHAGNRVEVAMSEDAAKAILIQYLLLPRP